MEPIGQQPRKTPGPGLAVPSRGIAVQAAEWIAERLIFAVAVLASTAVLLIFVFVGREALPVLLGSVTTVNSSEVIRPQDIGTVSPERLRSYLGLSPAEFRSRDREAIRLLLEVRAEAIAEEAAASGPAPNAAALPMLLLPYRWNGYPAPAYVWQPGLWSPKYNMVPLLLGSLKVTLIAMSVAVPLALAAALHVSQLASSRFRAWAKPAVELLSGVPGVVLGSLALMAFAPVFQRLTGAPFLLNATVAGVALGFAVIPLVFSLSEEALSGVPVDLTRAALALGATRWQAAWHVALPAALPGVASAVVLGFGRALGETMIVLIASGNAPLLGWNPLLPVRTITATIAAELGETAFYGHHYRMLFLLGTVLFVVTFAINLAASAVFRRLRRGTEGAA